ncbi:unnamed protein product [Meganyctiphanes norvegica]|uniref:Tyrosine-protein kinase Drl n=1 Tax=Meganyctiphanes norvegica TaxID=48144 RepID=A0AAV2QR40_MEGNR
MLIGKLVFKNTSGYDWANSIQGTNLCMSTITVANRDSVMRETNIGLFKKMFGVHSSGLPHRRRSATSSTTMTAWLPLLLALLPCLTSASFNLYLTKPEVKRTLGLDAELYYVREGVLNEYALTYRVLIAADIHSLYFTWVSTVKKPIKYSMAIMVNNTAISSGIMYKPSLNVSTTGTVPREVETFRFDLPCTGQQNAELAVTLNINVTSNRPRNPPTSVYIMRRKVCLKGTSAQQFAPHISTPNEEIVYKHSPLSALYYIIAAVAGVCLVLAILILTIFVRKWKMKQHTEHTILTSSNQISCKSGDAIMGTSSLQKGSHQNNYTYVLPSSYSINSYASIKRNNSLKPKFIPNALSPSSVGTMERESSVYQDNESSIYNCVDHSLCHGLECAMGSTEDKKIYMSRGLSHDTFKSASSVSKSEIVVNPSTAELQERFRLMEVDRQKISLSAIVYEGSYSKVYRGWIKKERPEQDQQVLIKTVSETSSQDEIVQLLREGTHLFNLYHQNILTLVGISFADNSSPYIIYPFHGYQNLKVHLQERLSGHLSSGELVSLAVQAAQGLAFLHSANVMHGDIAARNCVVSEKLQLRICDAGLSQDLFPEDYEVSPKEQQSRPIKWMAYETINNHIISSASDVWSYGVLLWELSTLANQPYVEVATCEMSDYLRDGYRLSQPLNCPDDLYKVMAFCWAIHPHDRPQAKVILEYMSSFTHQLTYM